MIDTTDDTGGTRTEIVRVIHAAGKLLDASEIYEGGRFSTKPSVYVALGELAKHPSGPLMREKVDGHGRFKYKIRPGFDVAKYLNDGLMQTRVPFAAAPRAQEKTASPEWPAGSPPKLADAKPHHAVLVDMRTKLAQLDEESAKLRNAIAVLEEIYGS